MRFRGDNDCFVGAIDLEDRKRPLAEPLTACCIPQTALGQLSCQHWMAGLRLRIRPLYEAAGIAAWSRILAAVDAATRVFSRHGRSAGLIRFCIP